MSSAVPIVLRMNASHPASTLDAHPRSSAAEVDLVPLAKMEGLAREWDELAFVASEPNSFAEPWFVLASARTLGAARDIRIAAIRRGGKLVGILPLAIECDYGRLTLPFVQNWCHHNCFLGTPLIQRGEERAFWLALLDRLDGTDWVPSFFHLRGLVEDGPVHRGLVEACAEAGRSCATVYREARALLESDLDPREYYERNVRPKKRKEIRRLQTRLAELGQVETRRLSEQDDLDGWCDAFLSLEKAGWKGEAGSALACDPATESFFREAVAGARSHGRLDFLRIDLDGRPIAMLVNFLASPGAFSFKTTFDEEFSRFSPGVLIQLENLAVLHRADTKWMDSCAVENHPMIDSLWAERRPVIRVSVQLRGLKRTSIYLACRLLEAGSASLRRLKENQRR